jgi:hypothetical protein
MTNNLVISARQSQMSLSASVMMAAFVRVEGSGSRSAESSESRLLKGPDQVVAISDSGLESGRWEHPRWVAGPARMTALGAPAIVSSG